MFCYKALYVIFQCHKRFFKILKIFHKFYKKFDLYLKIFFKLRMHLTIITRCWESEKLDAQLLKVELCYDMWF